MQTITDTRALCEQQATQTLANLITKTVQAKGKAVLGIVGGTSVQGVYTQLLTQNIPWKHVHIFMLDEACVSLNSLDSNYRTASHLFINDLIAHKKLPPQNTHPFIFNPDNAFGSLRAYDNDHMKLGGLFDLVLLSAGGDGHVAALYPHHASIKNEGTRFIFIQDAPKPPKHRMTASRKLLLKASASISLFFGPGKEKAWQAFNDPASTIVSCPIKLVKDIPDSYVYRSAD